MDIKVRLDPLKLGPCVSVSILERKKKKKKALSPGR